MVLTIKLNFQLQYANELSLISSLHLDLILEHGLLDVTSFGDPSGVLHEIAVGQAGDQGRKSQSHSDRRFVRMNDRVVVDVTMVGNTNRLVVRLHVTVENVDRLQSSDNSSETRGRVEETTDDRMKGRKDGWKDHKNERR